MSSLLDLAALETEDDLLAALDQAEEVIAASADPATVFEAHAHAAEIRAELAYRDARKEYAMPPGGGSEAGKHVLGVAVDAAFYARVEALVKAAEEDMGEFIRRALSAEADKVERRMIQEEAGEGNVGLKKYKNRRKAARKLQAR